mmetsp:Transcript_9980/g.13996  ORF Transcript_9980/g.13996 Transcript_9980/m.13996 type:complete len:257 (+) Transcript_9980:317-1087(+)
MRPHLRLPNLPPLPIQSRQIILGIPYRILGRLRRVIIPLSLNDIRRLVQFLKGESDGRFILLPPHKVPVVPVLAFEAFDEFWVVAVVFAEDVGHVVELFGVVLFVEGEDALLGGRADAEAVAEGAQDVVLLEERSEPVPGVEEGGEDGGAGHEDEEDEGRCLDALGGGGGWLLQGSALFLDFGDFLLLFRFGGGCVFVARVLFYGWVLSGGAWRARHGGDAVVLFFGWLLIKFVHCFFRSFGACFFSFVFPPDFTL